MKHRFGITVGILAAFLLATFGVAGTASAASAEVSATVNQLVKQVNQAKKQRNQAQKQAKKAKQQAKKAKKAQKKVCKKKGKKAKKQCKKAKKKVKKANQKVKQANKKLNQAKKKVQQANKKLNNNRFFDVCAHGCDYRTVQEGANDAGKWQFITKKHNAVVRVQPGTYVEGVFVYTEKTKLKRDFDGMTIMGVDANKQPLADPTEVLMEGDNASTIVKGNDPFWQEGDPETKPAQNAIEARNVKDFKIKNMQGQNYKNNVFFVWASTNPAFNERCEDYEMSNLKANDTRAYGLFARNCFGGLMKDSEAWNTGDSGIYIGETPCDDPNWNNRQGGVVCQANPNWAVIDNVESRQNTLGYSGTNSKYVEIKNSAFYNNGAGIVPNTLDSEKFEPAGWMKIHDNDVFWNNYNYYCTGVAPATCDGTEFHTVSGGLGELLGSTVNFPTGVGVMLFGTDGIEVYDNNIFGNEKWGSANFASPVSVPMDVISNVDDDAKNLNNSFIDNRMGLDGADPNGTDFLTDNTGGGNCWSGNTAGTGHTLTWALGLNFGNPGTKTQEQIYPDCPQPVVFNTPSVSSLDLIQGIQVKIIDDGSGGIGVDPDPETILGYAGSNPPDQQECSWDTPVTPTGPNQFHPTYTGANGKTYVEVRTNPAVCS